MKIVACEQRTPEWAAARLGLLTGSRVADAFATIKKGEAAGRRNLRTQLVLERLTQQSQEGDFCSPDMERGMALEPDAYAAYEAETGRLVQSVGFVMHDDLLTGCSPDGLTFEGVIEIKCPKAATHLEYLRDGLPGKYLLQIQHSLWITGAAWGDFVSYHPAFPPEVRLKVTRVLASCCDFDAHEREVRRFLAEVDAEERSVRALMAVPA